MLVLREADVAAVLSMRDAIDAVERALRSQAAQEVAQPLRAVARPARGFLGAMPASIAGIGMGAKIVTFFPSNAARGLHTHHAAIVLLDSETGVPIALTDGRLITEIRTAATSAIATRALAVAGADVVAILGTGVQARAHIDALRTVGMLRELRVWGRTPANAEVLVSWADDRGIAAVSAPTVAAACKGAQIVCTVTPATSAIVDAGDVAVGSHINAVGAGAARMQELGPALVGRSRIVVDTIEGALSEAGDIMTAIREGTLAAQPELILLCDVIAGKAPGRRSPEEITLFKSLGMAIEDVACAALAFERARARGLGVEVSL
jgi:ornithine cyclodeaminase